MEIDKNKKRPHTCQILPSRVANRLPWQDTKMIGTGHQVRTRPSPALPDAFRAPRHGVGWGMSGPRLLNPAPAASSHSGILVALAQCATGAGCLAARMGSGRPFTPPPLRCEGARGASYCVGKGVGSGPPGPGMARGGGTRTCQITTPPRPSAWLGTRNAGVRAFSQRCRAQLQSADRARCHAPQTRAHTLSSPLRPYAPRLAPRHVVRPNHRGCTP